LKNAILFQKNAKNREKAYSPKDKNTENTEKFAIDIDFVKKA